METVIHERGFVNELLKLAAKGLLSSMKPSKRYKKMMAITKIKNQSFFGKVEENTVKFRRPTPYKTENV